MDEQNQSPQPTQGVYPSDFKLDALHAGELEGAEKEELLKYIANSKECQARMREREQGFAAFGGGSEQAYLARFRNRLDEVEREEKAEAKEAPPRPWFYTLFSKPWLPALVGAAVVLLVWNLRDYKSASPTPTPVSTLDSDNGIRSKGGAAFRVYLQRDEKVREISERSTLTQGDRLRFKVSVPKAAHFMLVGEESKNSLYPIATDDGQQSVFLDAGADQLLENTIELDGSIGKEWIHLVNCEDSFHFSELKVLGHATLLLPSGCSYRSFAINKVAKSEQ